MALYIDADMELYGPPRFTVGAKNSLRMEIRGSCAGGSINLYSTDFNIMYYALRYAVKGVIMNCRAKATMRAWLSDAHQARPRLSGSCDFMKRERGRLDNEVLPALTEFAEVGLDFSDLTKYCVMRFVGSNWASPLVMARAGRTLDQFAVQLQELHESLVVQGLIERGDVVRGELSTENSAEATDARTETERLRLQLAEQATARVNIAPLPAAFMRLNINATVQRSNNVIPNPNGTPSTTTTTTTSSNSNSSSNATSVFAHSNQVGDSEMMD